MVEVQQVTQVRSASNRSAISVSLARRRFSDELDAEPLVAVHEAAGGGGGAGHQLVAGDAGAGVGEAGPGKGDLPEAIGAVNVPPSARSCPG